MLEIAYIYRNNIICEHRYLCVINTRKYMNQELGWYMVFYLLTFKFYKYL